jgi:tetratricopeptide (TPR) repeat protein
MYPYLEPYGIIMKINRDPLPTPVQDPALWKRIVDRDKTYWDKLCADFDARPEFHRDGDAQKTFSKLRSAIGGIYATQKLYDAAMYAFQQSVRLCPESPEGNFRLAQLYTEVGRLDEAIATLKNYQQHDPLNKRIGEAIQRLNELKQQNVQLQQLEEAVAATPSNIPQALQLAQVYNQLGKPDKAAPLQEHALAAQPRDAQLVAQLAKTYGQLRRPDMILSLCDGYLAQTNLPAGDMIVIAQAYLSASQVDKCISTLQLILQRYPQDAGAYFGLARVRAAQSMVKDSIDALETAIRLNAGYRDLARKGPWPENVSGDPRFKALVGVLASGSLGGMP